MVRSARGVKEGYGKQHEHKLEDGACRGTRANRLGHFSCAPKVNIGGHYDAVRLPFRASFGGA